MTQAPPAFCWSAVLLFINDRFQDTQQNPAASDPPSAERRQRGDRGFDGVGQDSGIPHALDPAPSIARGERERRGGGGGGGVTKGKRREPLPIGRRA